jgi:SAM-dependent methyltransferase
VLAQRNDADTGPSVGLLGDTPARDYSRKLQLFNAFAEPELRQAIATLELNAGMRVLDAGCGTGEALAWLRRAVEPGGDVIGFDLAASHVTAARVGTAPETLVVQANLIRPPLRPASLDLIWCVNTVNHLRDPLRGISALTALLRPGGRIALGQSSLLADMYFAWDARLERVTNEAVRRYYRDRYGLDERDLTAVRSLLGLLRESGLGNVTARTFVIERVAPLRAPDEAYLFETIFHGTWGERLRPYLSSEDYAELTRLSDPQHPQFALRRRDFHFLQTFTLVTGDV